MILLIFHISLPMSLMASPSSSKPRNYKFKVFSSFHGPDVRKTFLSHLREQFQGSGITMFDDEKIKRGGDLSPSLKRAIKESKISIVILSKKYASSSWCLDELVEIMKRKKAMKQIVMTVFYGVEPSDVRKQSGDFGITFDETCAGKTDKARQKWSKALTDVSNIPGEDFKKWDNEANMIKKIARDVSDKLNATPSRDFEDMVGLEFHLKKIQSLLRLESTDEAMIVGISGPAGIGKTTIARALLSRLSDRFQLTCFMDLSGSDHTGLHDYGQQLRLQEQLLSKVFNQDGTTRICHLGVLQQRLSDLRVLIILDEVNDVKQLKALAKETTWFGPGSRIIVTTEHKDLLQQRGISNTYHVGFPSREEALEILCKYAFEQSSPPHGFKKLATSITHLCGNLPLGLCVMGSSLFGRKQDEWEYVMRRLKTNPGREIDDVLRVSYERLHEDDQMLFLHVAVFFNNKNCDLVEAMLGDDGNLDVKTWLKILVNKSLIEINPTGEIVMHKLLEQVGRQATLRQEPWKRKILINAHEICAILRSEKGTSNVSGISFDTSGISEVTISDGAFKSLHDLRFLHVYKSRYDGNNRVHIPGKVAFPPGLRLLYWEAYPSKYFPPTFNLECLVELCMPGSKVEKLWEGTQSVRNLKKMDLSWSKNLKELPDLSNATNLEELNLMYCEILVEIPSSFSHLHKLERLSMTGCINLKVIAAHMNLASLKYVYMRGTSRLRKFPVISTHIESLYITNNTELEEVPASIALWCRLRYLRLSHNEKLKGITHLPTSLTTLDLSDTDIERIPDCIKDLHKLDSLDISGCRRLTSLPKLPCSLEWFWAECCESLETVFSPLYHPDASLRFKNCFKLGGEARTAIIRQQFSLGSALLPGKQVPAEFDHRAKGNSLTIILNGRSTSEDLSQVTICVVISPNREMTKMNDSSALVCRINRNLYPYEEWFNIGHDYKYRKEHLFIFNYRLLHIDPSEAGTEIKLEISSKFQDFDIIECGVKIWRNPRSIRRRYLVFEDANENEDKDDRTNRVTREEFDQILMDEIDGSNNAGCGDEDERKIHMCSHEETSDDDTAGGRFESESDEEEDDDECYKSEPGESSNDDDDEDYECVNKCSRVKLLNIISSFIVFCLACIFFYQSV